MSKGASIKIFMFCICAVVVSFVVANPLFAQENVDQKISVLVLGSVSRLQVGAYMVDETFAQKMHEDGITVVYMPYEDLTWDALKQFNVVVLTMEPIYDKTNKVWMGGYDKYKAVEPLFYDFLKQGGGVYVFVDAEGMGQRVPELMSQFLQPLGARLSYQLLYEADEDCHFFDQFYRACATSSINKDHPATKNVSTFWYFGWGTLPIVVDDSWTVLVKSGKSTKVEEIKTDYVKNADPIAGHGTPIIASRSWGDGRIIVQAGLSSMHLQAGYSPKWGSGWCLENGGGLDYFRDSFVWLSEPSRTSGKFGGYFGTQEELFDPIEILKRGTPFKEVPPEKQPQTGNIYKGISGPRITEGVTVEDFTRVAKEEGFDFIIFLQPDPAKEAWEKLAADCKAASSDEFLAIPGTEFDYEGGNSGFAFSLSKWPPVRYHVTQFLLVMFANNGYGLAHPNPVPPNMMGFFNLFEVYAYDKNLNLIGSQRDMFDTLTKYDWFPLPFANYRIEDPEKLKGFHGYCEYVVADSLNDIEVAMTARARNSFLSSGPIVKSFWIEGAGVNDDFFEGRSYTWTSDEDVLTIHLSLVSEKPLSTITLLEDGNVMRVFQPADGGEKSAEGYVFETTVRKPSDQSNHTFWLIANDSGGGEAISKSLRTRGTYFWAHGGSDRANTYDGLFIEHPKGQFYWLGHQTTNIGGIQFDLCRGHMNYSNPFPPVPGADMMPVCAYETGGPIGGLGGFQPTYPKLYTSDGEIPPSPIARRYNYEATGGDVRIIDEDCFNNGYIETDPKTGHVTKMEFLANDYFKEHNTYINYRWKAYGVLAMIIDKKLTFHKDVQLTSRPDALEVEMTWLGGKDWSRDHLKGYSFVDLDGSVVHMPGLDFRNSSRILGQGKLGIGGFIGLWHDPYGDFGLASLDDNEYDYIVYNDPAIYVGYEWPDRIIPAGTVMKSKHLTYLTPGTEKPDGSFQETFFKQFGFRGKPKWDLKLEQGYVTSQRYEIIVEAERYGVKGTISNGLVIDPIPLRVRNINPNWEVGIVIPAQNKLRRTALWDNTGFFVLEPVDDSPMDFYAGNILLCSRDFIKLALIKSDENGIEVDVHNPSDEQVQCTIWTPDMAPTLPQCKTQLELKPFETITVTLQPQPK